MIDSRTIENWTDQKLSMRSGYYAGRGPTTSDLDSQILESIYVGISKDAGAEEARNFVRFVNKLDDLSASAFIVALEQFAASGFKDICIKQKASDRNRISGYGDEAAAQGMAAIGHAFGGPHRTEADIIQLSHDIKYGFVAKHRAEIPEDERQEGFHPYGFDRLRGYHQPVFHRGEKLD